MKIFYLFSIYMYFKLFVITQEILKMRKQFYTKILETEISF